MKKPPVGGFLLGTKGRAGEWSTSPSVRRLSLPDRLHRQAQAHGPQYRA